jgi:hypothetical protein
MKLDRRFSEKELIEKYVENLEDYYNQEFNRDSEKMLLDFPFPFPADKVLKALKQRYLTIKKIELREDGLYEVWL